MPHRLQKSEGRRRDEQSVSSQVERPGDRTRIAWIEGLPCNLARSIWPTTALDSVLREEIARVEGLLICAATSTVGERDGRGLNPPAIHDGPSGSG